MQPGWLKWGLLGLLAVFIGAVEWVRHLVRGVPYSLADHLLFFVLLIAGAYVLVEVAFRWANRLRSQVEEQNHELRVLNHISSLLTRSLDPEKALTITLDEAMKAVGAEAGEIFTIDEESGDVLLRLHRGADPDAFSQTRRFRPGQGFPGIVVQTGQPILARDLKNDPRFLRSRVKEAGFQTFMGVPVRSQDRVVGMLAVASRGALGPGAERILDGIGRHAGLMLANAALHARVTETRDHLNRLIEDSGDAIITYDLQGRVLSWNRGAEEIFGWTTAEAVGQVMPALPDNLRQETLAMLERVGRGEVLNAVPVRRVCKDGRVLEMVVTLSPLRNAAGEVIGCSSIAKDITEQRRLALDVAVLKERERIGMDLHDGVIQSIYGVGLNVELALDALDGRPEEAQDRLQRVQGQLQAVIRDIRNYIFNLRVPSTGRDDLQKALQELVQEFSDNSLAPASLEVSELTTDVLRQLSLEQAAHLLHIAREALTNASKHAGGSRVEVCLSRVEGQLLLRIQDQGPGFDPSALPDRGYGLRNMAARAESIGGSLHVESAPGAGTRVQVRLPLVPARVAQ